MRSRSMTYEDLNECITEAKIIKTSKRRHSLTERASLNQIERIPSCDMLTPIKNEDQTIVSRKAKLKYEENEYTIILKAIEDAVSQNDKERYNELKLNLLSLEKRAYSDSEEGSEDSPLQPSRKCCSTGIASPEISPIDERHIEAIIKNNTKQYDLKVYVLLAGEHKSGKTTLINTYINEKEEYTSTNGIEQKSIICENMWNKKIKLMFWDTDSNRHHESIRTVYYSKANALLFVFDVTCRSSFDNLVFWIESISKVQKQNRIGLLVGTNTDQIMRRVCLQPGCEVQRGLWYG